jgi:plastocyanin
MEATETYKVGDTVKWCWTETHKNTYTIIDINSTSVVLKQNFGMGLILNGRVPISELER